MNTKTKIQKVKEIIEAENLATERALEAIVFNFTLLEIEEEKTNALVIRASDFDCFTIPTTIIEASLKFDFSFMVTSRFFVDEHKEMKDYPVLKLLF